MKKIAIALSALLLVSCSSGVQSTQYTQQLINTTTTTIEFSLSDFVVCRTFVDKYGDSGINTQGWFTNIKLSSFDFYLSMADFGEVKGDINHLIDSQLLIVENLTLSKYFLSLSEIWAIEIDLEASSNIDLILKTIVQSDLIAHQFVQTCLNNDVSMDQPFYLIPSSIDPKSIPI